MFRKRTGEEGERTVFSQQGGRAEGQKEVRGGWWVADTCWEAERKVVAS